MRTLVEERDRVAVARYEPLTLDFPAAVDAQRDAALVAALVAEPVPLDPPARGPRRGRGAAGTVLLAAGALVAAALLTRPAAAPLVPQAPHAVQAASLPPMPASMGFWDFVQPPPAPLPPMPSDLGFGDRFG
jgi:hypothetical protein